MQSRTAVLASALAALGAGPVAQAQVVLDRPTVIYDSGGVSRFTALEVRRLAPEHYEVTLRYDGRTTGIQYFRNEVDCQRDRVMSVNHGDTLEEARRPRPTAWVAPTWATLVEGSSRWRVARLACNGQIYP